MWPPTTPMLTISIVGQCIAVLEHFRVDAIAIAAAVTNITDASFGLSVSGAFQSVCAKQIHPTLSTIVLKQTNDRVSHKIYPEKLIVSSVSHRMRPDGPSSIRICILHWQDIGRVSIRKTKTPHRIHRLTTQTLSFRYKISFRIAELMFCYISQHHWLPNSNHFIVPTLFGTARIQYSESRRWMKESAHEKRVEGAKAEDERKMEKIALHYLCRCCFCVVSKRHSHPNAWHSAPPLVVDGCGVHISKPLCCVLIVFSTLLRIYSYSSFGILRGSWMAAGYACRWYACVHCAFAVVIDVDGCRLNCCSCNSKLSSSPSPWL